MNLPSDVIELHPPSNLILADNVAPSCAIAQDAIYYLHFAGKVGVSGGAVMRVVKYPHGSVNGEEVKISLNPNAAGKFLAYKGVLSVMANHDEYDPVSGKKLKVHAVSVPIPGAEGPFEIF